MDLSSKDKREILSICKLACYHQIRISEAQMYLKRKFGVETAHFSLDGKALVIFEDGSKLSFEFSNYNSSVSRLSRRK